jgi:hypothetical protein
MRDESSYGWLQFRGMHSVFRRACADAFLFLFGFRVHSIRDEWMGAVVSMANDTTGIDVTWDARDDVVIVAIVRRPTPYSWSFDRRNRIGLHRLIEEMAGAVPDVVAVAMQMQVGTAAAMELTVVEQAATIRTDGRAVLRGDFSSLHAVSNE